MAQPHSPIPADACAPPLGQRPRPMLYWWRASAARGGASHPAAGRRKRNSKPSPSPQDAADDLSFALFYYTGAASRAGMSYSGAVLGTPDGKWPEAHAGRIAKALDRAGIKSWELSYVDNSACAGAPLALEA